MTVLCIDDDLEDLELLGEAIRTIDTNYTCRIATDGRKALEILNLPVLPDFIFLDMNMPLMNGKQTLKAIRSNQAFNKIPICILSTTVTSTEREIFAKMGANFCLKKATTFEEFCSDLKSVLTAKQMI
jgi:CheY-like chemotaxis protein